MPLLRAYCGVRWVRHPMCVILLRRYVEMSAVIAEHIEESRCAALFSVEALIRIAW